MFRWMCPADEHSHAVGRGGYQVISARLRNMAATAGNSLGSSCFTSAINSSAVGGMNGATDLRDI